MNKRDFIEIEFTGRVKNGEVFDSNIKEDLEKLHLGHNHPIETKPIIVCLGEQMFLKSVEDFLIGKEIGEYSIELSPEKAFGKRDASLMIKIPMNTFKEHKINPVPGVVFNFDGRPAKILAVSGGRAIVDFNNPLAGKEVEYKIKIKRKVDSQGEQIKSLISFLFRRELDFKIKEKKIILEIEPQLKKFAEMFSDKFKEIFGLDLEVLEKKENNSTKAPEHKEANKKPQ